MTAIDASLIKFHISLNASDLDRSIAFYRALFGKVLNPGGESHILLSWSRSGV
jgi:predicted enzyme related to lactoylglutathione lyase